jgi:D-glycero-alpha-D-manno-heptose-7-phosphate kinase
MTDRLTNILENKTIEVSAPCRIDMGGTLDIDTFSLPLHHLSPCTFNIALNLRTRVRLHPYHQDLVKVSSKGFDQAEYPLNKAPFDHPLGLIFAIAAYFRAEGVHIVIDSSSPPRGALGGSSSAAVALVAALRMASEELSLTFHARKKIALLAHDLEESVAGVPCGKQDQLAAVYGGINAWRWQPEIRGAVFKKETIIQQPYHKAFKEHILLAYCGVPHESKKINSLWVKQFLSARYREQWIEIVRVTQKFIDALRRRNYKEAARAMNREMMIRRKMTPEVLDNMGEKLVSAAVQRNCGARFTGAGGGGCIWALGEAEHINKLRPRWEERLSKREGGCLLDIGIDSEGLLT